MNDTTTPDTTYLDTVRPDGNCPGFYLWDALASDGRVYRMAGDHEGGVDVRLFFRTNGRLTLISATKVGDNPAVDEWDALRASTRRTR